MMIQQAFASHPNGDTSRILMVGLWCCGVALSLPSLAVADVNHPPVAVCDGDVTKNVLRKRVQAGDTISMTAAGSRDPDGDTLKYCWSIYREAGDYEGIPMLDTPESPQTRLQLSPDARGHVHVLLEVADDGKPRLTSYRRVVLTVGL